MSTTNIVVAVRNRCLLDGEVDCNPPIEVENGNVIKHKGHSYTYDYLFGKNCTNQEVYENVVKNKISNLFDGFNLTILAYGSTGSGKTFTMGTDYEETIPNERVGIIPQGIDDIFNMIEDQKDTKEFIVKVSYVEIYNEEVYDLGIRKGKFQDLKDKLQIAESENPKGKLEPPIVEVKNLTQKVVHNTKQALQYLMKGSGRRHTGETAKNKFSSRSHAIFNVVVQQTDKSTGSGMSAKFQLVDLAGSERASTSQTSGLRLKEGTQINRGLFQLSYVINLLSSAKVPFINYRSSKLTHILRDSLGGNTYTVMIACINPSSTSAEETLSTLRYAYSARKIKNKPKINVDSAADQLKQLQKENEALNAELYKLRSTKSAVNTIFDSKASQMLEAAYFKVNSLNEKLLEVEEEYSALKEKIKSFYDILNTVVLNMASAAVTDEHIKTEMAKLESVRNECFQLMLNKDLNINVKDDDSFKNNENADIDESEFNNSGDTSEEESELPIASGKQLFKEVEDRQTSAMNELKSINFALEVKTNMCKELNFLQDRINYSVAEDKENILESQIQQLIKEKKELMDTMEHEKMGLKENAEKVAKYEEKLKSLQKELRDVKRNLQLKWETQEKVNRLTREIQELKKYRVELTKQRNQVSNERRRIEMEKNRDIMRFQKKERKQEIERTKMAENYKSKIRVLEARVLRYEQSDMRHQKRNLKTEKSKQPLASKEESIEAKLQIAVENNLMKMELEEMKNDADCLEQNIKKMEDLSPSDEKKNVQSVHELKAQLCDLLVKISTMKNNALEIEKKTKPCVLLDSLPNLPAEAKTVVGTLFNKCVMARVEITKHLDKCNEESEKKVKDMEKKMKMLINESELATQDLEKKIENLKNQLNQQQKDELENKEATEFKELINFPTESSQSSLEASTSNLVGTGETEDPDDEILQVLQAAYDEKSAEVAELEKRLGDLKNRKRNRKWLTKLSSEDADTYQSTEVYERASMLEEYLSTDNEESFSNDKNDPDWRATPLHKQAKRRRVESSAESKGELKIHQPGEAGPFISGSLSFETMDTSENILLPVKPKSSCECVGDCKTNRCKCKRNNFICSEACKCITSRCNNVMDPIV